MVHYFAKQKNHLNHNCHVNINKITFLMLVHFEQFFTKFLSQLNLVFYQQSPCCKLSYHHHLNHQQKAHHCMQQACTFVATTFFLFFCTFFILQFTSPLFAHNHNCLLMLVVTNSPSLHAHCHTIVINFSFFFSSSFKTKVASSLYIESGKTFLLQIFFFFSFFFPFPCFLFVLSFNHINQLSLQVVDKAHHWGGKGGKGGGQTFHMVHKPSPIV